ncbi:MAG TPA: trehalose-6-phosphate synthase [Alphaproteobacteria bacterium]|nr:trehalose-6-phosphate synthase [Alphaproteobacteria bacterium]
MGRIVVVSNRVSTAPTSSSTANIGGLAIAVHAALDYESAIWFGWTGEIADHAPSSPRVLNDGRLTRILVDLSREDYRRYYAGFSNRTLWPLFHYRIDLVEFDHRNYIAYRRVSETFARHLEGFLQPEDLVWIHDYHLIPLASALRARGIGNRLGFFLHTPFPAREVLTTLPVHEELVRGLCAYDVVGFQTRDDLHAFRDYIVREAEGTVGSEGIVSAFGCNTYADAYPISIDPEATAARAERGAAGNQARRLRESLAGRELIIGVDRLDYSKGLIKRFEAVEQLLEEHPEHRRRLVVLQIAPPTRGDVPEYQHLRSTLDAQIGHINGRFAEPDLLPVRYLNRHFGQETLFGFYRASSIGLVTPLRDGMNLVAKEYVASQDPADPGVLVLSRFAGAAHELKDALIVNPYDTTAVAAALDRALNMALDERQRRYEAMMSALRRNDIRAWRDAFLRALSKPTLPFREVKRARRPTPLTAY